MSEQLEIAGAEDPARNPDVEERLRAWLDAKDEQRRASDKRKEREHLLLVAMAEQGLERYPYVDGHSGEKRFFVADKTPKPKTVAAGGGRGKTRGDIEVREASTDPSSDDPPVDNVVEMRVVKRTAEHDQVSDPFAATRSAMEDPDDVLATANGELEQPKKRKGKAKR